MPIFSQNNLHVSSKSKQTLTKNRLSTQYPHKYTIGFFYGYFANSFDMAIYG